MPSPDLDPRRVRRHQCQRDPPVGRPSQQAVRIVQAESQADQRRDRRQGDVAFLPVEADAQNGFSILLPLADHAGVLEGRRVRPGAWPGQAEAGRLLPSGKPGEVMILLFLRAVAQQQLARAERVGDHDRNRSRDAAAGDLHDHFGMSKRRETQAAVLFRQHHSEKLLLPDQLPGFRREVVVGRRDAPIVQQRAQALHGPFEKLPFRLGELCRFALQDLLPVGGTGEQRLLPACNARLQGFALGVGQGRQGLAQPMPGRLDDDGLPPALMNPHQHRYHPRRHHQNRPPERRHERQHPQQQRQSRRGQPDPEICGMNRNQRPADDQQDEPGQLAENRA